jgi:hypothetical protein
MKILDASREIPGTLGQRPTEKQQAIPAQRPKAGNGLPRHGLFFTLIKSGNFMKVREDMRGNGGA